MARVVLPWPFGGLFSWMSDIGLALMLSLLLAWDRQAGFGIVRGFFALCVEGALLSISTLSRGVYFFHTIPPLVTEGMHTYRLGKIRTLAVLFGTWLLVGVAIPSTTTFLRLAGANAVPSTPAELIASQKANNTHYEATVRPKAERPMSESSSSPSRIMLKQLIPVMQVVLIDRWTGLEGVMAAVAYPHKDMALLKDAAVFHRSYGTVDVYTRKISGSSFTEENAKKYHYATLAGPIAFLYFSGSLLVVFFGMALISLLMSAVELFWVWLVRDRLIVAMSGLYLALIVLQFSGGLVQAATGVVTVTFAFAGIWLLGDMQDRTPGTHGPEQSKRYGIGY